MKVNRWGHFYFEGGIIWLCNSKTKKKFDDLKGEGEDIQVSYNSPALEPLYTYFQDHIAGLLVFYLPPHRLLTLCEMAK